MSDSNLSYHDTANSASVRNVSENKVIFLNIFTIPEGKKAEELVKILENATREVMQYQPGFYSSTLHVSLDESRVINYVIWDSAEDFKNMRKDPTAIAHMAEIKESFPPEGRLYKPVSTISVGNRA